MVSFAKYSYKQLKWVIIEKPAARNAYLEGKLGDEWKNMSAQIDESFEEIIFLCLNRTIVEEIIRRD